MQSNDEVERLRELVQDERARRAYAERALTEERERAKVWRTRAEERLEALRNLRNSGSWLQRFVGRRRKDAAGPPTPEQRHATAFRPENDRGVQIYHPTLRVAAWNGPGWLAAAADRVDLSEGRDSIFDADLVWIGGPGATELLGDWIELPARQPLVLWEARQEVLEEWRSHLMPRDLVVGPHEVSGVQHMDPRVVVDPRIERSDVDVEYETADWRTPHRKIVVRALGRSPLVWHGESIPPELEGLVMREEGDFEKAGIRARLTAIRDYHPGITLEEVAGKVGLDMSPTLPKVGILLISRRPDRVGTVLEQISRLKYPRYEVILGLHGWRRTDELRDHISSLSLDDSVEIVEFASEIPLGKCLNHAAEISGANMLAKFDDDDRYGPWYLDEAVDELSVSGADLIGKATQFVHLTGSDQLLLYQPGNENQVVGYVNGPTFVMPRRTWEIVRFPHRRARVDSVFVRGLKAVGGTIRSSSRFEFILGRYPEGHTWEATEERFLASSELVGAGRDDSQVWLGAESP